MSQAGSAQVSFLLRAVEGGSDNVAEPDVWSNTKEGLTNQGANEMICQIARAILGLQ